MNIWRTVLALLVVMAVLAAGCADFSDDAAINLVAGFGGETGFDPCEAGEDTQCAATQVAEEMERAKQASDLTVDAFESVADQDYDAARTDLGRAILLRPGDRELHGYRIAVDIVRGSKPTASDLATFTANRDPLAAMGDLALVYGHLLYYLIVTDGSPEAIAPISNAYCHLRASFLLKLGGIPLEDMSTEQRDTATELDKQTNLTPLQDLGCKME